MHMIYDKPLNAFIFAVALAIAALFLALTLMDLSQPLDPRVINDLLFRNLIRSYALVHKRNVTVHRIVRQTDGFVFHYSNQTIVPASSPVLTDRWAQ